MDESKSLIVGSILARESFYFYARWVFHDRHGYPWQQAAHHQTICDALMRVYEGKCKRLIINIPPRYSKTSLIEAFIGWTLGHNPDSEYIYTSYSSRLASNSTWQVREIVQSEVYQQIFPECVLRQDSQARDEWRTTAGGIVYATGAGGTITGYGAGKHRPGFGGAILIDDPIKPEDARSETIRQNVLDWFPSTLESRKNSPDTPIIIIMQRLHEEDLSGWLLNGGNGEEWDHVCLPALREDGTALWPDKHDADKLRQMQDAAPYSFAGQYQQRPAPLEGGLFKPDRIEIIDAIPALPITWLRGWDLASTTDGDWTAGAKLGKLPDGRFIIADMVRVRVGPDERDAMMLNTAKRDTFATRISIPQDPGQAGKTQIAYLTRQFTGFRVHSSPESGDKVTRAEPLAAQVNVGNVLMLRGSWNDALIDEMRMFPNGTFDDQIDGMSRAFSELIGKFTMNISPEVLLKASR
jgi:predicted phage terminase large subunit-like protein